MGRGHGCDVNGRSGCGSGERGGGGGGVGGRGETALVKGAFALWDGWDRVYGDVESRDGDGAVGVVVDVAGEMGGGEDGGGEGEEGEEGNERGHGGWEYTKD